MPSPKYAGPVAGVHDPQAVFPGGPRGYPVRPRDGVLPAPSAREFGSMVREFDANAEVFSTADPVSFARYRDYRDLCANGVVRPVSHLAQYDPEARGWLIFCEWVVPYEAMAVGRRV